MTAVAGREQRDLAEEEDGGGGGDGVEDTYAKSASRRLVATVPASGAEAAAEPRYLAATTAGRMSARAYRKLNHEVAGYDNYSCNNSSGSNVHGKKGLLRGSSPLLAVKNMSKNTPLVVRPGRSSSKEGGHGGSKSVMSEGAGRRQQRRRRRRRSRDRVDGGQGDFPSQSDVSVSSCGDMTISSEEQEGHELAYTG